VGFEICVTLGDFLDKAIFMLPKLREFSFTQSRNFALTESDCFMTKVRLAQEMFAYTALA
jgi:hypothetical protein